MKKWQELTQSDHRLLHYRENVVEEEGGGNSVNVLRYQELVWVPFLIEKTVADKNSHNH